MSTTALPVLYDASPASQVNTPRGGQLRHTIVQAAQQLNDVQWGGAGQISGTTQTIPTSRLWVMWEDEDKDPERVRQMRESLRTEGQKEPLIVTPARDPRSQSEGGTGGEYLIIQGRYRYWGSFGIGPALEDLDCIVQVFDNAYSIFYSALVMKASQRELTDKQAGQWLRRLRAIFRGARKRNPDLQWPKQVEWARVLGRDQSTVSRWLAIADMDEEVQEAIEGGRMSEGAAVELLPLPRAEQREVATQLLEEAAREGAPTIPQKKVRALVQQRRRGPVQWVDAGAIQLPLDLVLTDLTDEAVPVALAKVAHDSIKLLEAALAGMPEKHPALIAWQRALTHPAIAEFIRQVVLESDQDD